MTPTALLVLTVFELGPNVWFARMELMYYEDTIVTCTYQIIEETLTVRCWNIETVSLPL